VRDRAARWVAQQLADDQAVLVADETGDKKSSTDAVAAARRTPARWAASACARLPCT
jgi:SRSO17 transposase